MACTMLWGRIVIVNAIKVRSWSTTNYKREVGIENACYATQCEDFWHGVTQ